MASVQFTLADGFFNRKRGRPPKNRFVQVYKNLHMPPQAVFTSFKLEKHATTKSANEHVDSKAIGGQYSYSKSMKSLQEIEKCSPHSRRNLTEKDNQNGNNIVELQPKPVVRSTGIYFPKSNCIKNRTEEYSKVDENRDSTEDLSRHHRSNDVLNSPSAFEMYSYLQILQLINIYYHQMNFPLQWCNGAEPINLKTYSPNGEGSLLKSDNFTFKNAAGEMDLTLSGTKR